MARRVGPWARIARVTLGRSRTETGFDAFLSYSRQADTARATTLQKRIERFAKPWYEPRPTRLFRDATTLAGSAGLWDSIVDGLRRSRWFILLASPAAARSSWVNREVTWWREHHPPGSMIIVLTAGEARWTGDGFDPEHSSAIPPALLGAFGQEPRWVDLRDARVTDDVDEADPLWADAIADITATIRGVDKDVLIGDHVLEQRRTVRWVRTATIVLVALVVVAVIGAGVALDQRSAAEAQTRIAGSELALARADQVRASDPSLAAQLDVVAYRIAPTPDTRAAVIGTQGTALSRPVLVPDATDGKQLAVRAATQDGGVIAASTFGVTIIDPATGRASPSVPAETSALTTDARGSLVVAPSALSDDTLRIYRPRGLSTPQLVGTVPLDPDGSRGELHLTADGGRVATIGVDGVWRSWDIRDPAHPIASPLDVTPIGRQNAPFTFSPDGRTVAVGSPDGTVGLWAVRPDGGLAPLSAVTGAGPVRTLAFSPDGRLLATGGEDQLIHLWFTAAPDHAVPLGTPLRGHQGPVTHLLFTDAGATLVSGSGDSTLRLWNLRDPLYDPPAGQVLVGHTHPVDALAQLPDGDLISSDGVASLRWSADHGVAQLAANNPGTRFQSDGRALFVGVEGSGANSFAGVSGLAAIVPVVDGHTLGTPVPLPLPGPALDVAPARALLAVTDGPIYRTSTIDLVDLSRPEHPIESRIPGPGSVTFDPTGDLMMVDRGRSDSDAHAGRLEQWDVHDPRHPQLRWSRVVGPFSTTVFDRTGDRMATLTSAENGPGRVEVWTDPRQASPTWSIPLATADGYSSVSVGAFILGPRGRSVITAAALPDRRGGQDARLDVWDLTASGPERTTQTLTGQPGITSLALSPDDTTVAAGATDGTIRLLDLGSGASPQGSAFSDVFDAQPAEGALGPDGRPVVASTSGAVTGLTFAADGATLASTGARRTRLWRLDADAVAQDVCAATGPSIDPATWARTLASLPYRTVC